MKQYSIDFKLLKDFFHSKLNRGIIGFSLVSIFIILIYFLSTPIFQVFPNRSDLKFVFYTDSLNGGHSKIVQGKVSNTGGILLDFDLKKGFLSPYVGISIAKKDSKGLDVSRYNQFCIEVKGQKVNGIAVTLFTANAQAISHSKDLCFNTNLGISTEKKQYRIGLDQLKVPDWWCDYNNISLNKKIEPDWANVFNINIGTAYTSIHEIKHQLYINRIWFERDNSTLIFFLIGTELILVFLLALIHYLRASANLKRKIEPIRIEYKSVEMNDDIDKIQFKGFINYINSNYHENELSLELVSSKTGINQRHITKYINETFDCNFKTYVNRIRINESKRLLVKKDLNIGEIAFKVGFSNQSHFNRVFKILEGMSPSEFREGKK